jgi:catechol 2,3-dioxygenase-like lactoylglutathione lyase family enzyme
MKTDQEMLRALRESGKGDRMTQPTTRGIDHIGLTVPNIVAAEHFLVQGLGAEFIYEMLGASAPPLKGPDLERAIGLPPGAQVNVIRMYKVAHGPGIELFQYTFPEQRPPARACDIGWQHIALYVDDIDKAVARAVAAGAELMADPWDMMGSEGGAGNRFCFVRAPFGAMIELITFPSAMPYEQGTALRRWKPPLEKTSS